MRKYVAIMVVGLMLAIGGTVYSAGKGPATNVSPKKHPNIAAAQKLTAEAYQKVEAAQKANEFDMGGHAQKAKDLLKQANDELKAAAEAANK